MIAAGVVGALVALIVVSAILTRILYATLAGKEREGQGAARSDGGVDMNPMTARGASRLFAAIWSGQVLASVDARTAKLIWALRLSHVVYFVVFFATLAVFLLGVFRAA